MRRFALLFILLIVSLFIFSPQNSVDADSVFGQVQKLRTSDFSGTIPSNTPNIEYGTSVATDGVWMVVGVPQPDGVGQAHVYKRVLNEWQLWRILRPETSSEPGMQFGYDVALSQTRIVVGAPGSTVTGSAAAGRVYYFDINQGGTENWGQVQDIPAFAPEVNGRFGHSVALTGDRLMIGSPYAGLTDTGAGYVYIAVGTFSHSRTMTGLHGASQFGWSVDIVGDRTLIGAPNGLNDDDVRTGRAYLYRKDDFTPNWPLVASLIGSDSAADDQFGYSVSIADNGTLARMMVGAPQNDTGALNAGKVYFYDVNGVQTDTFANSTPAANDFFGFSTAMIVTDALVGAAGDDAGGVDSGLAYSFRHDGTNWGTEVAHTAADAAAGDYYGWSVAISPTLGAIGARYDVEDETVFAPGAPNAGAVQTISNPGGSGWVTDPTELVAHIFLPGHSNADNFGTSVAFVPDSLLAVGSPFDDTKGTDAGAVYIYVWDNLNFEWDPQTKLTATFTQAGDNFGASVAFDGNVLYVGAPGFDGFPATVSNSGAVYSFQYDGVENWAQNFERTPTTPIVDGLFGQSVAASGDVVVVGEPGGNGKVYAYRGPGLASPTEIVASDGALGDRFGWSVAISDPDDLIADDETIVVGAPVRNTSAGGAYAYTGAAFGTETILTPTTSTSFDLFGHAVSTHSNQIVVGAPGLNSFEGGAFVFSGANFATATPILPTTPVAGAEYGYSVSMDAGSIVVGAPKIGVGIVYFWLGSGAAWTEDGFMSPDIADGSAGDQFGTSLAFANGSYLIGSVLDDESALTDVGSAYLFALDPEIIITESDTSTDVVEEGETTDTYEVTLNQTPRAEVTVTLNFDDDQLLAGDSATPTTSPVTLTFNATNWNTPQTITVQAVDDDIDEAAIHTSSINHASTSVGDPRWNIGGPSVVVNITDDDTAGVTITENVAGTNISEDGATSSYQVVLNSEPLDDVEVEITFDPTEVTINGDNTSPASVTFTPVLWDSEQTVNVVAVNDREVEDAHTDILSHITRSTDNNYDLAPFAPSQDVTVNIADNDTATIAFSSSTGAASEDTAYTGYAELTIVSDGLVGTEQLAIPITVDITETEISAFTPEDYTLSSNSVTFPVGEQTGDVQPITVSINDDSLIEPDEDFELGFDTVSVPAVASASGEQLVTIIDNDTAVVRFETSSFTTTEANGVTSSTYTVNAVLDLNPTNGILLSNVVVGIDEEALSAVTPADYLLETASVSFDTTDSSGTMKPIEVTISNDQLVEGVEDFRLHLQVTSGDATVGGPHTVTIGDNDSATIAFDPLDDSIPEAEGPYFATAQLTITSDPAGGNLAAPISVVVNPGDVEAILPDDYDLVDTSVDFNLGADSTATDTVEVTIVSDEIDEIDETFELNFGSITGTPADVVTANSFQTVTITDDDEAGVTITQTDSSTDVTESSTPVSDTYEVVLETEPMADLTVDLSFNTLGSEILVSVDGGPYTDSPVSLTFNDSNWSTPQVVSVRANNDDLVEGNHTDVITHVVNSPDDEPYDGITPVIDGIPGDEITVNITDNDTATIVYNPTTDTVDEADGTYLATVELSVVTDPVGGSLETAITASVSAFNLTTEAGDYTLDTPSVTFNGLISSGSETVTVTINDDQFVEGNEDFRLEFGTLTGDSADAVTATSTQTVTITDNDTAVVAFTSNAETVAEEIGTYNAEVTLTITANGVSGTGQLEDELTVPVTATDGTAISVNPADYALASANVIFAANSTSGTGSAIVTIVNDVLFELDETFTLTLDTPTTGVATIGANASQIVTIDENETATVEFQSATSTVTEGTGGTNTHNVTVVLSLTANGVGAPTLQDAFSIGGDTGGDTAISVEDFGAATGFTFNAGAGDGATNSIGVEIVTDAIDEDDETFFVLMQSVPSYVTHSGSAHEVTILDDDVAGVTVTPLTIAVNETLTTSDTFDVVLDTEPTGVVTITMLFDETNVTVNGNTTGTTTITFDANDWDTAKTVTVTAVDDADAEGTHQSVIELAASSVADTNYNLLGASVDDVTVNITDNDVPGVSIVESGTTDLDEAVVGSSDTYTVVLDSQPSDSVTITIAFDETQVTVDGEIDGDATLTFDDVTWLNPQTITVEVVDDNIDEAPTYTTDLTHTVASTDPDYDNLAIQPTNIVTVNIADDDTADVVINPTTADVAEAGATTDTYLVTLGSEPVAAVTVSLTFDETQISVEGDITGAVDVTLDATNWNTGVTVEVTAVDDDLDETDTHTTDITHTVSSTDGNYNPSPFSAGSVVTVNITDDDTAGVTIVQSDTNTAVAEDGSVVDSYTVILNSQPTQDVTVTLTFDGQVMLNSDTTGSLDLLFTAADWNTAQTVNVVAVDDDVDEVSPHTSTITHAVTSTDPNYAPTVPFTPSADVVVSITDDDTADTVVTPTDITVVENGAGASFTVVLASQPLADVTVTLTFDATELQAPAASPTTLTFTNLNWNLAQTVNVTAVNDNIDENDRLDIPITVATTSAGDSNYNDDLIVADKTVLVDITEDDVTGVVITETDADTIVREGFFNDTYNVRLSSEPVDDVTVTLTFTSAQIQVNGINAPITLTFTPLDWNVDQTLTVSALEDFVVDAGTEVITHDIASTLDANYNALVDATLDVTVLDGVTGAPEAFTLLTPANNTFFPNAAAITTFTWEDTTAFTFDITVDRVPVDGVGELFFDNFTRDADADTLTCDGAQCTLMIGAAEQALLLDGTYHWTVLAINPLGSSTASNAPFIFAVNDAPGVTITESGTTDVAEGSATVDTYTVVLDSPPTQDVTVTLTFDAAQLVVNGNTSGSVALTFLTTNWDTAQPVSVVAADDALDETDPHTATISHAVTSVDLNYNPAPVTPSANVVVNITDNDIGALVITESDGNTTVTENGAGDSYTVALSSQPAANVTVTLTFDQAELQVAANSGAAGGSPVTLTFTAANWNAPQTVDVTALEDFMVDAGPQIIAHVVTSTDPSYQGLPQQDVTVNVIDGVGNLLYNGSFEIAGTRAKLADGWTGRLLSPTNDRRVCNKPGKPAVAFDQNCAFRFRFTGTIINTQSRVLIQKILNPTYGAAGDILTLSAQVSARNLVNNARLQLKVKYGPGMRDVARVNITAGTYAYTQISTNLTLTGQPLKIIVAIQPRSTSGTFFVDDVRLELSSAPRQSRSLDGLLPLPSDN